MPPTPPARDARPRCPTCGKPVTWQGNPARPFCSVTCQLLDLGTWLDEAYRMPGLPLSREAPDPEPQREGPGELG